MTENISVFQLAKEFNIKALELIDKIKPLDLKIKNHMAELTPEQADKVRKYLLNPSKEDAPAKKKTVVRSKAAAKAPVAAAPAAPARPSVVITRSKPAAVAAAVEKEVDSGSTTVIRRRGAAASAVEPSAEEVVREASPVAHEIEAESAAEMPMVAAHEEIEVAAPEAPAFEPESQSQFEEPAIETPPAVEAASVEVEPESVEAPASMVAAAEPVAPSAPAATPVSPTPAAASAPAAPAAPGLGSAPRRTTRFSVIRVVSPEPAQRTRPLIVEEAPANAEKTYGQRRGPGEKPGTAPKTFSDPDLARAGSSLLRQAEEEEQRRKKAASGPRREDETSNFKSTDYLRRERVYQAKKKKLSLGQASRKTNITVASAHKRMVEFDSEISVESLAEQMSVKAFEVAKKLKVLGVTQPDESEGFYDWILDLETTQLVAHEFDFEVKDVTFREEDIIEQAHGADDDANKVPRPAVVTIMGHVDHGKTSLLDIIRRARVAAGEAGGITQHIGAYTIAVSEAVKNLTANKEGGKKDKKDKKDAKAPKAKPGSAAERLTFLDTPGHAAFTSMRARGASVTDIVILVVSAVDGVMPQTREAIEHAKAAEVPLIVAVNKMDLPDANPDRIRQQLSELGLISEEWGGDTIFVPVSAKSGDGIDKLLEMIQLQAELLELKARAEGPAEGTIIEAKLDKGRGPVATVLIASGTLKIGDFIVAGTQTGKVRALVDDKGQTVREAGPSTPVEILGLSGVPEAGDLLTALQDEKASRQLAEHRVEQQRAESGGASLEDLYARMSQGDLKELPVIIKADVKGSAEAIQFALQKLPQDKVRLKVLSASVGGVSESDVLLASASKAVIFGFNVRPDPKAQAEAERRGVQIKPYSIIYDLIDEVTKAMEGMLAPTLKETVMGRAEVRNVFSLSKSGTVAGCAVIKGKVQRSNSVRLIRDNRVIYTGKLSGLKRFKDDAREVAEGYECGISIENYNDIKQGDVIEAYMTESIAGTLGSAPSASA